MQQQIETLDNKEQIARLEALYQDFMEEYKSIVLPWGFGHGMPDAISAKATEVMNHAYSVLEKLEAMCKESGIERNRNREPNANAVLMQSHNNTPEFRANVALCLGLTETEMSEFIAQEVFFFLEENDAQRKGAMLDSIKFWAWVYGRLHPVNISIVAMGLNGTKDPMILRQQWKQGVSRRLASYETSVSYLHHFPKYYQG